MDIRMDGWPDNWSYQCESDSEEAGSSFSEDSTGSPRMEAVKIDKESLLLPQGLCDSPDIFRELFSTDTMKLLMENHKADIEKLLPDFPENDAAEKNQTLNMFFNREIIRFGENDLNNFQQKLGGAYFRPDVSKMRSMLRKAQIKDYKRAEKWRAFELFKSVLASRKRVSEAVANGEKPKVNYQPIKKKNNTHINNVKMRYFQELSLIRGEVGETKSDDSEDECFPEGPSLVKKPKRPVNLEMFGCDRVPPVLGTLCSGPWDAKTQQTNPYSVPEQTYTQMLAIHSKRRATKEEHPDLQVDGITLQDIAIRAKCIKKLPNSKPSAPRKVKIKNNIAPSVSSPVMVDDEVEEIHNNADETANAISSISLKYDHDDELDKVDVENLDNVFIMRHNVSNIATMTSPKTSKRASPSIFNKKVKPEVVENRPVPIPTQTSPQPQPLTQHYKKIEEPKKRINSNDVSTLTPPLTPTSRKIIKNDNWTTPSKKIKIEVEPIKPVETKPEPISTVKIDPLPVYINSIKPNTKILYPPATLSDLDGIDMMDLPVDFEESSPLDLDELRHPELIQEIHSCFFSLIRDILLSTPDHRIDIKELESRVKAWVNCPIAALNPWHAPNLDSQLHSAIQFLTGDLIEILPEDYVPYMEFKAAANAYQWIGAGRDSDHRLVVLNRVWLERGVDRGIPVVLTPVIKEGHENASHTPRGPAVQPTNPRDRESFRTQEKNRFENPGNSFVYKINGFESVVGPVRSIQATNLSKARGHTLLIDDRPKYVTILELVRDAVARLPNAQGTRADIVTLLKDSQYLSETAAETMLSSVVSGALDRLHGEIDPTVKYDAKRKIWVYLHKGRSAEEFERLHALGVDLRQSKPKVSRKTPKSRKEVVKIDVPEINAVVSQPESIIIQDSNVIAITSGGPQEQLKPIIVQTKPKTIQKTVTVTAAQKKVLTEGIVKAVVNKTNQRTVKIDGSTSPVPQPQQHIVRVGGQLPQGLMSTIKRPQELQKNFPLQGRATIIDNPTLGRQPSVVKKVPPPNAAVTQDISKQVGKSIVKVISTQAPVVQSGQIRSVQRGPQINHQAQQVIQIKHQIIGDQKVIQKGQVKKNALAGQQLFVMKQSGDNNQNQQMILINQPPLVMDSQQLSLKHQKQLQQLLNKQHFEIQGNSNTNLQQQQLHQLILAKTGQTTDQQKQNKAQHQMVVVGKTGGNMSSNDGKSVPQMIIVKSNSADGEAPQITHQQLQQMLMLKQQQQQNQQQQPNQQQQIIMIKQSDQKSVQVIAHNQKGQPQQVTIAQLQQMQQQQQRSVATTSFVSSPRVVSHVGQTVSTVSSTSQGKQQGLTSSPQLVAKVVSSTSQPVLTMESLLAHQKQQQTVSTQANMRLPATSRTVTSQYVVTAPQSRVVQSSVSQVVSSGATGVVAVSSLDSNVTKIATSQGVRIPGLNLAQISGKQVLLASKPQGQNVVLSNTGSQAVIVGGGQQVAVIQTTHGGQQLLIPQGAFKSLQGLKVVPLQGKPQGRPQMFARIITPNSVRPVMSSTVTRQESPAAISQASPTAKSE